MKFIVLGILALFVVVLSMSPTSIRLTEKLIDVNGEKTLRCSYFTGYGVADKDFAVRTGITKCPFTVQGLK